MLPLKIFLTISLLLFAGCTPQKKKTQLQTMESSHSIVEECIDFSKKQQGDFSQKELKRLFQIEFEDERAAFLKEIERKNKLIDYYKDLIEGNYNKIENESINYLISFYKNIGIYKYKMQQIKYNYQKVLSMIECMNFISEKEAKKYILSHCQSMPRYIKQLKIDIKQFEDYIQDFLMYLVNFADSTLVLNKKLIYFLEEENESYIHDMINVWGKLEQLLSYLEKNFSYQLQQTKDNDQSEKQQ